MRRDGIIGKGIMVMVMTIISVLLTYGYQYVFCIMMKSGGNPMSLILMLFLSGVPAIAAQLLFALIAKKTERYEGQEICLIIIADMVLFIAAMFLLFPKIPVAYEIIPSAEMGFDFLQLLIQVISASAAGGCAIVSGIILAIRKGREKEGI